MWSRFVAKPVCKANGHQNKHCDRFYFHIKLSWTKSRRSAKAKLLHEHFSGVRVISVTRRISFARQDYTLSLLSHEDYTDPVFAVALVKSLTPVNLRKAFKDKPTWRWQNNPTQAVLIRKRPSWAWLIPCEITANFRSNWKLNFEDLEIIQLKVESRGAADRGTRMIRNFELCVCL